MPLQPGDRALVQLLRDAQPDLWQERMLGARISGSRWVVVDPEGQLQTLDLMPGRDVSAIKWLLPRRRLPQGVDEDNVLFVHIPHRRGHDWSQREVNDLLLQASGQAEVLRTLPAPAVAGLDRDDGAPPARPAPHRLTGKQTVSAPLRPRPAALLPVRDGEPAPRGPEPSGPDVDGEPLTPPGSGAARDDYTGGQWQVLKARGGMNYGDTVRSTLGY